MQQLKKIETKIEFLRGYLHSLIDQNESLLTKEVVFTSQYLDKVLNEYNDLTKATLS